MNLSQQILDSLPDEIILIDTKTRKIALANKQFERRHGIKPGQAAGKMCHHFYHANDRPDTGCMLYKTLKTGKAACREIYDSRNSRYISITTAPLMQNSRFILHITRDISMRRFHEAELKRLNRQLLRLGETSAKLQRSISLDKSAKIIINAFQSLGYDRVRIYLKKGDRFFGLKSSHLPDDVFSKVVLTITKDYPKVYAALATRKPVIIKEQRTRYTSVLDKDDVEESAALPLLSAKKPIGLISLDNKFSRNSIRQTDLHFLMTFVNQAASAIENFLLLEENKRKVEVLSALHEISSTFALTLDLQKTLSIICARAVRLLKAEYCILYLLNESKDALVPQSYFSSRGKIIKLKNLPARFANGKLCTAHAMQARCISSPMLIENTPIGLIFVSSKRKNLGSHEDMEFLRSLCSQSAIVIENSRLYERIRTDKEQLSSLIEISQALNSTLEEEKLLELVLQKLSEYTGAEKAAIYASEDSGLRLVMGQWYPEDIAKRDDTSAHASARCLKPVIYTDKISEAALPIILNGKAIGVLRLGKARDNFKKYRKSLEILTSHISAALENSRMYAEIRSFNLKLKVEVDKATKDLKAANQELRKMDQMKSDFVSNVSHELRTPLTSISGYTKLLSTGKLGPLTRQQAESLKIVSDETERLTRLINDVLDLSKLESGRFKPDFVPLKLDRIAKEAVATMKAQAQEKKIRLSLKTVKTGEILGSHDLLKQVFINLIGNAVKFTDHKGSISVSVWMDSDFVHAAVTDTGIGIPKESLPKLFSKFYQVDTSMTRQRGGTGLGLVIVKHIITQHGGKIEVRSEQGKGSEFSFKIPLIKK